MEQIIEIGKTYKVIDGTRNRALRIKGTTFEGYTITIQKINAGNKANKVAGMLYRNGKEIYNTGNDDRLYYIKPSELGLEVKV